MLENFEKIIKAYALEGDTFNPFYRYSPGTESTPGEHYRIGHCPTDLRAILDKHNIAHYKIYKGAFEYTCIDRDQLKYFTSAVVTEVEESIKNKKTRVENFKKQVEEQVQTGFNARFVISPICVFSGEPEVSLHIYTDDQEQEKRISSSFENENFHLGTLSDDDPAKYKISIVIEEKHFEQFKSIIQQIKNAPPPAAPSLALRQ